MNRWEEDLREPVTNYLAGLVFVGGVTFAFGFLAGVVFSLVV